MVLALVGSLVRSLVLQYQKSFEMRSKPLVVRLAFVRLALAFVRPSVRPSYLYAGWIGPIFLEAYSL